MLTEILGGAVLGGLLFGGGTHETRVVCRTTPEDIAQGIFLAGEMREAATKEREWLADTGVALIEGGTKDVPFDWDVTLEYVRRLGSQDAFRVTYLFHKGDYSYECKVSLWEVLTKGDSAFPRPEGILANILARQSVDATGVYLPGMLLKRVVPSISWRDEIPHEVRHQFCQDGFSDFIQQIRKAMSRKEFSDYASGFLFSSRRGLVDKRASV